MSKRPDILAVLPDKERLQLIRDTVHDILGPKVGKQAWDRMQPVLTYKRRQIGDDPDPARSYWKGVWRIYEAE